MDLSEASLESLINQRAKSLLYWSEKDLLKILFYLSDAFDSAQKLGISHRDIKDRNILLCNGSYVIADFGDSKLDTLSNFKGMDSLSASVNFMAPEVYKAFENNKTVIYNHYKADVYSLGLVILKMAKLGLNHQRENRNITKEIAGLENYTLLPQILKKMLETKPGMRITWRGIKETIAEKMDTLKNHQLLDDLHINQRLISNMPSKPVETELYKNFEYLSKGYFDMGNYPEAMKNLMQAMDHFIISRNSDEGMLKYRTQIAACFRRLNLPKKAIENDYKALELLRKMK
jgi:serine/threonine protein kinase